MSKDQLSVQPRQSDKVPVPLGRMSKPKANGGGKTASAETNVEQQLWRIIASGEAEPAVRRSFRKLLMGSTDAIGVCHVLPNDDQTWSIPSTDVLGRTPEGEAFERELTAACESAITRQSTKILRPAVPQGTQVLLLPILNFGIRPEVLLTLFPIDADWGRTLPTVEKIANGLKVWKKSIQASKTDWKLNSLATIVELVSKIEDCRAYNTAMELLANELARHLQCTIAVGTAGKKRPHLAAVSGVSKLNRRSRQTWAFQQVLNESRLRDTEGVFPVGDDEDGDDMLLLAHKQLVGQLQVEAVRSRKLQSACRKHVGFLVLAGSKETIESDRMKKFLDASVPRIASALDVVARAERSWIARKLAGIPRVIAKAKTQFSIAIFALLMAIMCCRFPYRVRCNCVIQPVHRRFVVAPFDGLVQETLAKPGDRVTQQQLLATMDGRSIRWDLAGVAAEREQARKTREVELANRNVPQAMLAQYEDQRLEARQSNLEFKKENLSIRSPIHGIVLSGSPEKNNASSVTTGDLLFEVAPLHPLKIEVSIPAEDVSHVEAGMEMQIRIDGFENQPVQGTVDRIYPRSEIRDANNVFIAEFVVKNEHGNYRPGMKGVARIDSRSYPLAWNLFHKPFDRIVARWF